MILTLKAKGYTIVLVEQNSACRPAEPFAYGEHGTIVIQFLKAELKANMACCKSTWVFEPVDAFKT
jgi:ABC-type branched-subunit amino acid transport system ATPase component